MEHRGLALHETMDIHEILAFKTLSMTKAKGMQILVTDEGLKALMNAEAEQSAKAIGELQRLLNHE